MEITQGITQNGLKNANHIGRPAKSAMHAERSPELSQEDSLFAPEPEPQIRRCPRCQSERIHASRKQSAFETLITALGGQVLRCHVCFRRSAWFGQNSLRVSNGRNQEGPFRPSRARDTSSGLRTRSQANPTPPRTNVSGDKSSALKPTAANHPVAVNPPLPEPSTINPKLSKPGTRIALQRMQEVNPGPQSTPAGEIVLGRAPKSAANQSPQVTAFPNTNAAGTALKPTFFSVPSAAQSVPVGSTPSVTPIVNDPIKQEQALPAQPECNISATKQLDDSKPASENTIDNSPISSEIAANPQTRTLRLGNKHTINLPKRLVERRKIGFRVTEIPAWPGQRPSSSSLTR